MNYKKLKKIIFFISTLYLILYIPITIIVYSNNFYLNNYDEKVINNKNIINITKDITNFFLHKKNNLDSKFGWNQNENTHFLDVRKIYDILFILSIISIFNFIYFFKKKELIKNSKINFFIIISLLLLLPIFKFFWDKIFHTILFSNNFWISQQNSLMDYLFNINYFKNGLIFLITTSSIINLIIYLILKYKKNYNSL